MQEWFPWYGQINQNKDFFVVQNILLPNLLQIVVNRTLSFSLWELVIVQSASKSLISLALLNTTAVTTKQVY